MKIELNGDEMLELFDCGNYFHISFLEQTFELNGKKFAVRSVERICTVDEFSRFTIPTYKYILEISVLRFVKSPQEIAAEEAVQKAESALKAAKDVLKTVKEK